MLSSDLSGEFAKAYKGKLCVPYLSIWKNLFNEEMRRRNYGSS